ncbi:exported hypothetical protein [uncultured Desulfatiglans sp.]|nr:exported hypothetical protein [uncultured Desulfatiglans sp.]
MRDFKCIGKSLMAISSAISLLVMTLLVSLGGSSAYAEQSLRFSSANPGGAWYILAVGVTEIIKKENPDFVFSIEPGGGYGSPIMVGEKKVNMGFAIAGSASDAIEGREPFKKKFSNIRSMGSLYIHYIQGAVLKDSGIKDFGDMEKKKLTSGPKGQISWFWVNKFLELYGIEADVRSLDFGASAEAVVDGHVDMFFIGVPMPYGPMSNLAMQRPMRLVTFKEEILDKFCKEIGGFKKYNLPKENIPYKGTEEGLITVGTPLIIITNDEESEDLIYKCVKAIAENISELENVSAAMKGFKPEDLAKDAGVPLHPGAMKYFKEVGWR